MPNLGSSFRDAVLRDVAYTLDLRLIHSGDPFHGVGYKGWMTSPEMTYHPDSRMSQTFSILITTSEAGKTH
jgi:hypothetical protein